MLIRVMAVVLWLCMPLSAPAAEWVDAGWQQISSRHYNKALLIWQQGINHIPDQRLFPSVGVYAHFPYALDQLKQIGPSFRVFIIRHHHQGRMLYYVLSARQTPINRNKRQLAMAELKQAAGITDTILAIAATTIKMQPAPTDYFSEAIAKPVRHISKPAPVIMATQPNSFSINRVEISGNQHISTDIILMSLSDFYGSGKTRSDLKLIQKKVLETYHMANIYHVKVKMPQLIDDTVHIVITEKR